MFGDCDVMNNKMSTKDVIQDDLGSAPPEAVKGTLFMVKFFIFTLVDVDFHTDTVCTSTSS